jgi:non-specific serine/threonine protein kinase
VQDLFDDGAVFVSLAPIRDPVLVAPAIAQALDLKESGGQPLIESLQQHLQTRRLLLLLDNFEQVVDAAPLIVQLLTVSPDLKILITSREALRFPGERLFPVPPLDLPPAPPSSLTDSGVCKRMQRFAAIRLFVECAQAVRPDFALTATNATAVTAICAHLDGLPLAIELIAARIQRLSPQALFAQLNRRFVLYTDGLRGMPDRQQSLSNAIEWSFGLLSVEEQTAFARLGVFVNGWAPAAAQAVAGGSRPGQSSPLVVPELLVALAGKSLLQSRAADSEPRYSMLETIREYALERLEAGGETDAVRRRHAEYNLELAETAEPHLSGPEQADWLNRLEADHDNLRAALTWGLESGEAALAMRLAGSLFRFWLVRGYLSEGRRWLGQVLAADQTQALPSAMRSKALNAAGSLAGMQNEMGQAAVYFEESLALQRALGNMAAVASLLNNLGVAARHQGDYRRAGQLMDESLGLSRKLDARAQTARTLNNAGLVATMQGDYDRAKSLLEESLALHREFGDRHGIAGTLHELGRVVLEQADVDRAASLLKESLTLHQELGDRVGLVDCLEGMAAVAGARSEPLLAIRLLSVADALREMLAAPVLSAYRPAYDRAVRTVRAQVDEAAFAAAWAEGRALPLETAMLKALEI